jgi:hypothetical protein
MLSEQQFDQVAQDMAAGGFSVKVAGPGQGSAPSGNVDMVGGHRGHYEDFPPTPQMTGSDIRDFATEGERPQVLAEPDVYLGGWPGQNPPRQSLDVSTANPTRDASSRYAGRLAAAERNQEAIGLIRKGEFVGERAYPYYDPKAPQTSRDPDLFDAAWASAHGNYGGDPVWKQIKGGE